MVLFLHGRWHEIFNNWRVFFASNWTELWTSYILILYITFKVKMKVSNLLHPLLLSLTDRHHPTRRWVRWWRTRPSTRPTPSTTSATQTTITSSFTPSLTSSGRTSWGVSVTESIRSSTLNVLFRIQLKAPGSTLEYVLYVLPLRAYNYGNFEYDLERLGKVRSLRFRCLGFFVYSPPLRNP